MKPSSPPLSRTDRRKKPVSGHPDGDHTPDPEPPGNGRRPTARECSRKNSSFGRCLPSSGRKRCVSAPGKAPCGVSPSRESGKNTLPRQGGVFNAPPAPIRPGQALERPPGQIHPLPVQLHAPSGKIPAPLFRSPRAAAPPGMSPHAVQAEHQPHLLAPGAADGSQRITGPAALPHILRHQGGPVVQPVPVPVHVEHPEQMPEMHGTAVNGRALPRQRPVSVRVGRGNLPFRLKGSVILPPVVEGPSRPYPPASRTQRERPGIICPGGKPGALQTPGTPSIRPFPWEEAVP